MHLILHTWREYTPPNTPFKCTRDFMILQTRHRSWTLVSRGSANILIRVKIFTTKRSVHLNFNSYMADSETLHVRTVFGNEIGFIKALLIFRKFSWLYSLSISFRTQKHQGDNDGKIHTSIVFSLKEEVGSLARALKLFEVNTQHSTMTRQPWACCFLQRHSSLRKYLIFSYSDDEVPPDQLICSVR